MQPDDSIRDMVAGEVHAARVRNEVPSPDEVLVVRCAYCARIIRRPRRVVERDNRRHGFVTCRHACRKAQLAKGERILVPDRESVTE